MPSPVTLVPPAHPSDAERHFGMKLAFETDCADVQASLRAGSVDFVLLDVRGPRSYAQGHVPGALNLPHREINSDRMMRWPHDTLFVVYCAGPHCNGADQAALKLSQLGRPVKIMIGGITGWADEGFPFETDTTIEA